MKLREGEQAVKAEVVRYVKGKMSVMPGVLTLTNQRLVFDRRNSVAMAFGLLGALLNTVLPRAVEVDLPLGEIAAFSRSKYGRNQNVIAVSARDGKESRFILNFDAWASALAQMNIPQAQPAATE